jgi:hypothetical protein
MYLGTHIHWILLNRKQLQELPTKRNLFPKRRLLQPSHVWEVTTAPKTPQVCVTDIESCSYAQTCSLSTTAWTNDWQRSRYNHDYADMDNLADRLISCVNITTDDYDGDGLSSWHDKDFYPSGEGEAI